MAAGAEWRTLPIEYGDLAPDFTPVAELLVEYFTDVGIYTTAKLLETSLLVQRHNANEVFATMLWDVQPMWEAGTWTDYTPPHSLRWGPLWNLWVTSNGEEGEEPPAGVRRLVELAQMRVQAVPGSAEDAALYDEIMQIHKDNTYLIGMAENVGYVLVTDAAMRNVPIQGQAIAGNNSGEQMFYADE